MTQLSEPAAVADVRVSGLRKSYGKVAAVAGVDLEIARGEFFTMLGPSGSGKTTTLRMIAGFERPDAGTVELAEQSPDKAAAIVAAAFERGLLLLACGMYGNVIRLLAPLTIEDAELDEGLTLLEESLDAAL